MKDLLFLGIETSCDETAAAVVSGNNEILSNIISSQVDLHRKYGGVVPELASRKHLELILPVLNEALTEAKIGLSDLDALAVTVGPGLIGALLIGLSTAKSLAYVTGLPLIGINHLEGHIAANFLEFAELEPPFMALIVSGGHTSLFYCPALVDYRLLGQTLDDAVGEAFDKIAGFLGLGYPGGPIIDKLALKGDETAVPLPRAMLKAKNYDFSLSGLKTAVINHVNSQGRKNVKLPDLCASFQAAIVDVLTAKTIRAANEKKVSQIVLAGGVVANSYLRRKMIEQASKEGLEVYFPPPVLCTDNAAMIARAAFHYHKKGVYLKLDSEPGPNLSL